MDKLAFANLANHYIHSGLVSTLFQCWHVVFIFWCRRQRTQRQLLWKRSQTQSMCTSPTYRRTTSPCRTRRSRHSEGNCRSPEASSTGSNGITMISARSSTRPSNENFLAPILATSCFKKTQIHTSVSSLGYFLQQQLTFILNVYLNIYMLSAPLDLVLAAFCRRQIYFCCGLKEDANLLTFFLYAFSYTLCEKYRIFNL